MALTQENVLDYLRFFCFFVRTGDDPFLIAEGLGQSEIPEGLTDQERAALAKVLRPTLYCGYLESSKDFYAMATMYYLNSVSICDFKIHVSGTIEMIGEVEDVIKNLSAKVNEPIRLLLPV